MRTRLVLATLLLVPRLAAATGLSVLTVDRVAAFRNDGGRVRVGRDPELTSLPAPACPAASAIALSSYPVAHQAGRDDDERRPGLCPMEEPDGGRRPVATFTTIPRRAAAYARSATVAGAC